MITTFCHCIGCPEFLGEQPDELLECPVCSESDEEYVCTVTFDDDVDDGDDEFVTTIY